MVKAFSEGRESIEDEPQSGRPSSWRTDENIDRIRDLLCSDRRLTIRMIGEKLNLTHTTFHQILTMNWGWEKFAQKWFQKTFRKTRRTSGRKGAFTFWIHLKVHFLEPVITGNEYWVFEYDPETKRQSMEWHSSTSPRSYKARMTKSKIKCFQLYCGNRRWSHPHRRRILETLRDEGSISWSRMFKNLRKHCL